jgi:putative N6-adenine-specific DNA methylase
MQQNEKMTEFFVVALPGLEDLVAAEIGDWFPEFERRTEHGGVTVYAPLERGLAMNLALKTPTRILLRIATFRCRDFPKLFNKIKDLPWAQWLDPSCDLEVQVSTRLSRLKIKSRIQETCADAWMEFQKQAGVKTNFTKKATLYARFLNDECTLSLDTSGERLHKRGERKHIGEAPLRETIAAALIQWVGRDFADGAEEVELVDPMMGSGTFLLEGTLRDHLVDRREFAFEAFVAFPRETPALRVSRPRFTHFVGFEMDKKAMAAARANLKRFADSLGTDAAIDVHAQDVFAAQALPPPAGRRRWLFANPPYGERLKVKEPLAEFYTRLFATCATVVDPARACFLLPGKAVKGKFPLPRGWKVLGKRPFVNGGIPVVAFVFGKA